jgi:hypothetical protein
MNGSKKTKRNSKLNFFADLLHFFFSQGFGICVAVTLWVQFPSTCGHPEFPVWPLSDKGGMRGSRIECDFFRGPENLGRSQNSNTQLIFVTSKSGDILVTL